MSKLLVGTDLAEFIKERQAKQVRNLRQTWGVKPRLVILQTGNNAPSNIYINKKKSYGEDILVEVEHLQVGQDELKEKILKYNNDKTVHGIIVQLPIEDPSDTDVILGLIDSTKDVDGLGGGDRFIAATPMAINWLLAGYNIDLTKKNILIVGKGRLVGDPLYKMWKNSKLKVQAIDENTPKPEKIIKKADVVVTATGVPGLISVDVIKKNAVVIDAGIAVEKGVLVGDVDSSVRLRKDIAITPKIGGVGPLTVAALFENVILSARNTAVDSDLVK